MKRFIHFAALALAMPLVFVSGSASAQEACSPRQLALTFDDAPRPDTAVMTGTERTQRIIGALREAGDAKAMFFVISSKVDDDTVARVHAYAAAGHAIANHSDTHANLHGIGADAFLADVEAADRVLAPLPGFARFFRYPMLNEGTTAEDRDKVRSRLAQLGYRQGYVTIDNFDFYIDKLLVDAVGRGQRPDLDTVGKLYVDMIVNAARHYDGIACKWLGRSPYHVLLLHENDVAALFLPRLIATLRDDGWELIDAVDAYDDPIASQEPDTLFLGQGRVAALAALAGAEESQLRSAGEDTGTLEQAFSAVLDVGEKTKP